MNSQYGSLRNNAGPRPSAHEVMADHRAQVLLEEEERARNRQLQLEIQRSNIHPPDMRIRAWEKGHGLRLPAIGTHPILIVIANDTGLTLKDVQEVQLARQAASPTTGKL